MDINNRIYFVTTIYYKVGQKGAPCSLLVAGPRTTRRLNSNADSDLSIIMNYFHLYYYYYLRQHSFETLTGLMTFPMEKGVIITSNMMIHHMENARRHPSPLCIHTRRSARDSEIRRDGHALDETEAV